MTHTKQYFLNVIGEAAQKALEIPATARDEGGKVLIEIDPAASDAPFWKAVREQCEE